MRITLKPLFFVVAALVTPVTYGADPNCNKSIIESNAKSMYQKALDTHNINAPQPGEITGCIDSLSALNFNIGSFDLSGIFDKLIQQACDMANSQIDGAVGGATQIINSGVPSGVPVDVNSGGVNVSAPKIGNLVQPSQQPAKSVLQSIFGGR